jgi:hypothetical protein
MLQKFFATAMGMAVISGAYSQDSTKSSAFKLSGSADVYYRYNFQNYKQAPYNNLTSFTNSQNSFELGMASLKAEHSIGKVGMVADLGFGKRAEEFSYNENADPNHKNSVAVKQLYITYSPSAKVKFTAGSWATHIGYELVDAYLNRNYSMSYMFSYGPFFHTGVKGEFTLGSKTVLMAGIANPTDLKYASTMPKTAIAQLATGSSDDKFKAYLNFQGGKPNDSSRLVQGDVVLTYAISPKLSLGYNGTLQSREFQSKNKWQGANKWFGSAFYVNLDPTSWFGLTLREEYFNDKKSVLGLGGNIIASTLSANFKIDNLTIIPELRLDNANTAIFHQSSGALDKSTESFLVAAVYHF